MPSQVQTIPGMQGSPISEEVFHYVVIAIGLRQVAIHPGTPWSKQEESTPHANTPFSHTWLWRTTVVIENRVQEIAEISFLWVSVHSVLVKNVFTAT